ncbi:ABC transporter ATP-binding protein [Anaerostipes sp.]|uniref:ABC transporter ATP-binding protein n=1 Tax=Anaerostipes sp. TaxID=1872530 RepID=UPI00257E8C73|nr:ABC transporter ATP-binding protein [Anaerostipes sp.]
MEALCLSHVTKSFGRKKVLQDLSFSVPEHSVFGFIGKNGAGKTTAMRLICGLLKADAGDITVCGNSVEKEPVKASCCIGYLPDVPQFYDDMTPYEYLTLCGKISRIPKSVLDSRITQLLQAVHLTPGSHRIKGFSRGMKQRLGIAQALLHRPKLLICDEPTSALDPSGRKEILDILSSAKKETTILFSTHVLSDVERICDQTALLHQGSIAFLKTREELQSLRHETDVEICFHTPEDLAKFHNIVPESRISGSLSLKFSRRQEHDILFLMDQLVRHQISVEKIERIRPSLEDLFLKTTGNEGDVS